MHQFIQPLESEWELDTGFLGQFREGYFDQDGFERIVKLLKAIPRNDDPMPKRLVSLLWFIPQFLEWNTERVAGPIPRSKSLEEKIAQVSNEVGDILGYP